MQELTITLILICAVQLGALTVVGCLLVWDYKQRAILRALIRKQAEDLALMVDQGHKSFGAVKSDIQAISDKVSGLIMKAGKL